VLCLFINSRKQEEQKQKQEPKAQQKNKQLAPATKSGSTGATRKEKLIYNLNDERCTQRSNILADQTG